MTPDEIPQSEKKRGGECYGRGNREVTQACSELPKGKYLCGYVNPIPGGRSFKTRCIEQLIIVTARSGRERKRVGDIASMTVARIGRTVGVEWLATNSCLPLKCMITLKSTQENFGREPWID
jgi:hypothetical protein